VCPFPYLPEQPAYDKRGKAAAPQICQAIFYRATNLPQQ
jgi:hypothetical protein